MSTPLVSVRVITYNHEKYIAQCLEGILMQRTDFPFEVIVGEDCSADRTREIVLDYQARFPDKIRVITSERNVGGMANAIRVQQACSGKYHALCEGDDYWIDPLKLQKQAEFMEANPDISMCCHDAYVMRDDKNASPRYYCSPNIPDRLRIYDLFERWRLFIPTASMFARSQLLASLPDWRTEIIYGDLLFRLWCAHHGDIGYLPEAMSVYRVHKTSLMAGLNNIEQRGNIYINLYSKFDKETNYQYEKEIQRALKEIKNEFRFLSRKTKWGWFAFLLHPGKLLEKLLEYLDILRRYRRMYDYRN